MASGFIACNQQHESEDRKQFFSNDWKFHLGDIEKASISEFDDSSWRPLDLPHDWSIEGQVKQSNPTSNDGGYFPAGIGWYRKTFSVPADYIGKKVSIYFEGVYMNAEVFVNGNSLGVHPYGYTSFKHDISQFLQFGKENVIAVKVDNSIQRNCRWYSGSGIYRHVWLQVTEPVNLDEWGLAITTPVANDNKASVKIEATINNEANLPKEALLKIQIKDQSNTEVSSQEKKVKLEANSALKVINELSIITPKLWTTETPNLYTAEISILSEGKEIDKLTETFGIRTIAFSAEEGFLLNGTPTTLNGGCVHHDNGCLGAAAFDRAEERKVELLKEAGFNAVRTAHNPPSEAFLDACDRLGLLVIDEAFDGWRTAKAPQAPMDYSLHFDKWWKKDIEAMVLRDRNHPSIIMWSIGNEIIERTSPEAVETARMLATHVRKLDPTRAVTSAMTSWGEGWEIFDPLMAEHDVCGYNYMLHLAESDHERVPSRVVFSTESYPRDAFYYWNLIQKNNFILGDFVWTAMDYLGESGIGGYYYPGEHADEHYRSDRFPWHGAYCGDIDLMGWRKPISHYRSMLYNDNEKLYMAVKEPNPENGKIIVTAWGVWPTWESWNWPGYEGKNVEVEVYSKYPKVALYLNDELISEKPTSVAEQFKATFSVPYQEGTLKAVGIENGKEVESTILETSDKAVAIDLIADRTELNADGQDLSYISIEMKDTNGILNPNAENQLTFSINGPGVIAGVDNANLKDTDLYVANSRKTWKGKALVIIRSTKKAGDITLTVTSPGMKESSINIKTIK